MVGFSRGLPLVLASFVAALQGMKSRRLIDTAMVDGRRKVVGEAVFDDINFTLPRAGV